MAPLNGRTTAATRLRPRVLPGPTFKLDQPMPCGCRVSRETDGRMRLWYCRTHLAAFQSLEALERAVQTLDRLPAGAPGDDDVDDVRFAVRAAIVKAKDREPW
jgi:hypothetical protein